MKKNNCLALLVLGVLLLCSCNSCSKGDDPVNKPEIEMPTDSVDTPQETCGYSACDSSFFCKRC